MKRQREITFIHIEENLTFYSHYPVGHKGRLQLSHSAGVQEMINGKNVARTYDGISEASILRLAKIQEKLAQ